MGRVQSRSRICGVHALEMIGWTLFLLLPYFSCAAKDQCRNYAAPLAEISVELVCVAIAANMFDAFNCDSFGAFCALTCGLCDSSFPTPVCDTAEVYKQKMALVDTLQAWGTCANCSVPLEWEPHQYVVTPPSAYNSISTTGYSSSVAGDPCSISGVTCNRCGEVIGLAFGFPQAFPIPYQTPLSMFRLHDLDAILVSGQSFNVPSAADLGTSFIPASAWRALPNLNVLVMFDAMTGEVPDLSESHALYFYTIAQNRLYGAGTLLFGGNSTLVMAFEQQGIQLESVPMPDSICNMTRLKIMEMAGLQLTGRIPDCIHLPAAEVIKLQGSFLEGSVASLLVSTSLRDVELDGHSFTGTLPESLSLGSSLLRLSFSGNQISGTLPDLTNHTALQLINAKGNRLTGAERMAGSYTVVDLSENEIQEFPPSFMSLPFVSFLDLSKNRIQHWPPAGVYDRGLFSGGIPTACSIPPKHEAFSWPDMDTIVLSSNDLQGQDVRDVLGSLAGLPRLRVIEANDCNMSMNLPMEGHESMLAQFNAAACDLVISDGFVGLGTLRVAGNRITSFDGGPWRSLQIFDIGNNKMTYMHPAWFTVDSRIIYQNYQDNHMLPLPVAFPADGAEGCTWNASSKLVANPRAFLPESPDAGYECTSLCAVNGLTLVDASANVTILCRCRPGWYGVGRECTECPLGFYCPGNTPEPMQCPVNATTWRMGSSLETECECQAGSYRTYSPLGALSCKLCPEDTYRPTPNAKSADECFPCALGTTSVPGTKDACDKCPNGTVPVASGRGCRSCSPGSFANSQTNECEACPLGQYQPDSGAVECIACEGTGNTTWSFSETDRRYIPSLNSKNASACGCESGRRPIGGSCVACGDGEQEGLQCQGGLSSEAVTLLPGYFSEGPMISVYRCWGEDRRCTGGLPGRTCRSRRIGLTCSHCEDGFATTSNGSCIACKGEAALKLIAAVVLVLCAMVLFYHIIDRHSRAKQQNTELIVSIILSLGLTAMQQLGLLSQMSVEWIDPLKSFLYGFLLLNFNLDLVHVDCVRNMDAPARFALRVTLILTFCVIMLLIHIAFVLTRHGGRFKERQASLVCSIGAVVTLFYIPVVVTISGPLQCQQHPNNKWTSNAYPSVVCWESSEHVGMVIGSVIALIMPLGYYVHAAYIVWHYPTRVRKGDVQFLKAYEFYFVRFAVKSYWYILVQIGRNLVLALSVIIPEGAVSIFASLVTLVVSLSITAISFPWRAKGSNVLDILLTACVMILFSAAFNFIPHANRNNDTISWICLLSVAALLATLPVLCFAVVFRRWMLKQKRFSYFLCHHKAGAGAFTRLLKICLVSRRDQSQNSVFLDSDNLAHLDQLFNHVRSETETVVAIWSRELLLRPWCAGEVTIARLAGVRILPIRMPDYIPVTPEFLSQYTEAVDLGQVYEYGITKDMIVESMSWLVDQADMIIVTGPPCSQLMEDLVTSLRSSKRGTIEQHVKLEYSPGPVKEDAFCICTDDSNTEAIAAGMVLEKYLVRMQSIGSDAYLLPVGGSLPASANAVIFICSGGCLESIQYLNLLAMASAHRFASIPVIAEESFRFLSPEQIAKLTPSTTIHVGFHDYVAGMFKEIAITFHAQSASGQVLRLATTNISIRLRSAVSRRPSAGKKDDSGQSVQPAPTLLTERHSERHSTGTHATAADVSNDGLQGQEGGDRAYDPEKALWESTPC